MNRFLKVVIDSCNDCPHRSPGDIAGFYYCISTNKLIADNPKIIDLGDKAFDIPDWCPLSVTHKETFRKTEEKCKKNGHGGK